ncbi:hypothetical protein PAHAL_2G476800 [Panicum hallii]|uniref:Uncharacterized protein n=1 Tax=Panicum hallii TaxID=206008 RepID=A0A2T8KT82_9POAL|nr:hypothetical protein PAHAL_2G476800 [Panicum hallii]
MCLFRSNFLLDTCHDLGCHVSPVGREMKVVEASIRKEKRTEGKGIEQKTRKALALLYLQLLSEPVPRFLLLPILYL